MRGAWIEISVLRRLVRPLVSLPVRGAWIEMPENLQALKVVTVAPRAGSVD